MSERVENLQPGDLTVTPVLDGFILGRMLPQLGIGVPWWTFIKIVEREADAILEAKAMASSENRRVWLSEGPGKFSLVPMNGSNERGPQSRPKNQAVS